MPFSNILMSVPDRYLFENTHQSPFDGILILAVRERFKR